MIHIPVGRSFDFNILNFSSLLSSPNFDPDWPSLYIEGEGLIHIEISWTLLRTCAVVILKKRTECNELVHCILNERRWRRKEDPSSVQSHLVPGTPEPSASPARNPVRVCPLCNHERLSRDHMSRNQHVQHRVCRQASAVADRGWMETAAGAAKTPPAAADDGDPAADEATTGMAARHRHCRPTNSLPAGPALQRKTNTNFDLSDFFHLLFNYSL